MYISYLIVYIRYSKHSLKKIFLLIFKRISEIRLIDNKNIKTEVRAQSVKKRP